MVRNDPPPKKNLFPFEMTRISVTAKTRTLNFQYGIDLEEYILGDNLISAGSILILPARAVYDRYLDRKIVLSTTFRDLRDVKLSHLFDNPAQTRWFKVRQGKNIPHLKRYFIEGTDDEIVIGLDDFTLLYLSI